MPVTSYFEVSAPRHTIVGDASDHTRYVKLMATVAPYINQGIHAAPTLGWKSPELSAQARLITPLFGILNGIIPNRR
jgi:hypothetical protein